MTSQDNVSGQHADTDAQLDGAAWDHGAPLADIKRLAEHWKTSFDWYDKSGGTSKIQLLI